MLAFRGASRQADVGGMLAKSGSGLTNPRQLKTTPKFQDLLFTLGL